MRGFAIGKCVNDLAKGGQTRVDLLGLVEGLAFRAGLGYLLTSGQVDQVQLACLGSQIHSVVLTDGEDEDHMRPRRPFVHVSRCDRPEVPCDFYEFVHLLHRRDVVFS